VNLMQRNKAKIVNDPVSVTRRRIRI
jgi:hypothetical protein